MDIEARTRVADTLAALLATHEELEIELGPERWTRFLEDLDAWMEDLTRARTDDEWNRLRVDLSALATRYNLHRRLDAALGRATQPQPREPTRGAESARRAASEEERSRTLSGRLRDLLGLDGPEALVTYPEARVPPKVELRTSFHLEVVAHPTPTAASPTALELTRKKRGPVNLDVEVRLPPGGAIEARGALTHPLRVPEGQESPRLSFPLFARALGKHPIEVDFKEKGISRLTLSCTTEVVEAQTDPLPATAPTVTSDALIAGAAAFRGLRLVLTPNDRHDPPRSFHVALVRHGVPGLDMIEANIHLPEGAPQLVVRLAGELGPRSLYAQYDTAEARESHLRRLGEQLAAIILPEPVASALAAAPEGAALHIESSDLWVPWELARLPLPKDDRAFLGEWFAVTRWLGPYPLRDHLPGGRPVLVAPTSSGVSSADERRALQELTGRPPEELCSFQEVQDLLHRSPVSSGRPAPSCGILHAISLHLLGVAECRQGNFSSARSLLVEALEILDKIGGRQGRAAPLHQLAIIEQHQGNLDKAHLLVSEAIQIEVEFGNRHGLAASLHVLGSIEFYRGNNTSARTHLRESINIMNEIGDRQGRAASLIMLGQVESIEGQMDEGRKLVREAVQILEEVGAGDLNRARKILDTLEQGTRNSPVETALACSHQALESGRLQEAAQHAEEAVLQARDANNGPGEAAALFLLGQALLGENQPGEAAACFERSGRLLEKHGTTEEARVVKQALTLARAQAGGDVAASEVDAADTPALAAGLLRAGKADKALELVRRALTALADAPEALAKARAFEAQALLALGRGEEALTAMEEGISTAADAGLDQLVGQLRGLRDQIRSVTQMQTIAATPVEVLEQRASGPAELSRLLLQKALTLAKNDPAAARDLLARARAAADASGDPRVRVAGLLNAAQILGALDDTDSARQALREALPLARLHLRDALGPIEALAQELGVSLD